MSISRELATPFKNPIRDDWLEAIRRAVANIHCPDGTLLVTYNENGIAIQSVKAVYDVPKAASGGGFDPTAISGYDATKQQILTHDSGTLAWVTLTAEESTDAFECPT